MYRNSVNIFQDYESSEPYILREKPPRPLLLLTPRLRLATVDQIVVEPPSEGSDVPVVSFIQTTKGSSHSVSPAAFFSMLLLLLSVKSVFGVQPRVRFIFAVPAETFSSFSCNAADALRRVFYDIEIKVADFTEYGEAPSPNSSPSPPSSSSPPHPPSSSSSS